MMKRSRTLLSNKAKFATEIRGILRRIPKAELNQMLGKPFTTASLERVTFDIVVMTVFAELPEATTPQELSKRMGVKS